MVLYDILQVVVVVIMKLQEEHLIKEQVVMEVELLEMFQDQMEMQEQLILVVAVVVWILILLTQLLLIMAVQESL
jgi:hypothetical protein